MVPNTRHAHFARHPTSHIPPQPDISGWAASPPQKMYLLKYFNMKTNTFRLFAETARKVGWM
jgi:hypothetical protein